MPDLQWQLIENVEIRDALLTLSLIRIIMILTLIVNFCKDLFQTQAEIAMSICRSIMCMFNVKGFTECNIQLVQKYSGNSN